MKPIVQKIWRYLTSASSKNCPNWDFWPFCRLCIISSNGRWTWCLVVFLQFASPVNVFLFFSFSGKSQQVNVYLVTVIFFLCFKYWPRVTVRTPNILIINEDLVAGLLMLLINLKVSPVDPEGGKPWLKGMVPRRSITLIIDFPYLIYRSYMFYFNNFCLLGQKKTEKQFLNTYRISDCWSGSTAL